MEGLNKDKSVTCKNCGEREFDECDGFFYCRECGTQQDQMRAVEVEEEQDFNETSKQAKKQKIIKEKSELPSLTSFECCNYVLRGLVEELLNFGVKEEFKLMTLQVWAAFLRRKEVAFISKTRAELPKLGVRYLDRDARTLYNHHRLKKKTSKEADISSNKSGLSEDTSDSQSKRRWRKSKRNLDASLYSSDSSRHSSSTGTAQPVIKLQFSSYARKYLKKNMSKGHLNKHATDSEGSLKCHRKPNTREIKHSEYVSTVLNIKQLFAIIGIALNLVQDDMQLCDFLYLIDGENFYNSKKILQYFPKNVASKTKEILQEIYFYGCPDKYSDKALRTQVCMLGRFLNIKNFKLPNMHKLIRRYVSELYLPAEVADIIERLINLLPIKMKTRAEGVYPAYEARAMAFIIYVLKIFFVLDGQTEIRISQASTKINEALRNCQQKSSSPPYLFVWTEWMEYVEMRKVIISQFNTQFSRKFQQHQSTSQQLDETVKNHRNMQAELEEKLGDEFQEAIRSHVVNLQHVMQLYVNRSSNSQEKKLESSNALRFPQTLTPATDYFDIIKKHFSTQSSRKTNDIPCLIPEFMHVNHTQRSLLPYLRDGNFRKLRNYMREHKIELRLQLLGCTSFKEQVGFFRGRNGNAYEKVEKADYNISNAEWLDGIELVNVPQKLIFNKELKTYHRDHIRRLQKKTKNRFEGANSFSIPYVHNDSAREQLDLKPSHFQFNEFNMDPIEGLNLDGPRSHLAVENVFAELSDLEEEAPTQTNASHTKILDFFASNFDCWILMGNVHSLWEGQKKDLLTRLPPSLRWLLKTCAHTIGVDASVVYEELLIIELMFSYGIENLDEIESCIQFRYNLPIKDLNSIVNMYREVW